MRIVETTLNDALVLEPHIYPDDRGFFLESWNRREFAKVTGINKEFVQDNHSRSTYGVLRGLHYQVKMVQGKLVRVVRGKIRDVIVDLRRSSSTFGKWYAVELSDANQRQLWIPEGFAHGFIVLSDVVDLLYKTTDYYSPKDERTIVWDDKDLSIDWGINNEDKIVLSEKDRYGKCFVESEYFV